MRFWSLVVISLWILLGAVFFSCDGNSEPGPELEVPVLVESIPANNAVGIARKTETAKLIFDRDIILVSKSRVLINNVETTEAFVQKDTLFIKLPFLEELSSYTIVLEEFAIKAVDGAVNDEEISISFTTAQNNDVEIDSNLVASNPSPEVTKLFKFLIDNYGEKILSSTMANVNWNINEAEWVNYHTGKYPAIATFDYIHLPYSPANWIDYTNTEVVENWWENNGIVSIGWHWLVPTFNGSTEYTYKPAETNFNASNATKEGTWENEIVKSDLEKLTGLLIQLKNKNIPVLWRPLHEASGNIYVYPNGTAWFWWGSGGAESFKELWIYMFDFFEEKGLNNLIWVWTTQMNDYDFYPGDTYVDIIGRDIYNNNEVSSINEEFSTMQETFPTKMITLSECGSIAKISDQWSANCKWSYFMPWYDYERTNDVDESDFIESGHEHANATWWIDAINQDFVITRDEMPNLK